MERCIVGAFVEQSSAAERADLRTGHYDEASALYPLTSPPSFVVMEKSRSASE